MRGQVWCGRCASKVLLEQDGVSCSNCGTKLVMAIPEQPKPPAGHDPPPRVRNRKKPAKK